MEEITNFLKFWVEWQNEYSGQFSGGKMKTNNQRPVRGEISVEK